MLEQLDDQWLGRDHGIDCALEEALPDEEEREALRESEYFDEFRIACEDADKSEPLQDLIRQTGRRMVRFFVRDGDDLDFSQALPDKTARALARAARIDFDRNKCPLRELVQNGRYGQLCVLAYVEMRDLDRCVEHILRDENDEPGVPAVHRSSPLGL